MKFLRALMISSLAICFTCNIFAETKEIGVKPNEITIETEGLACAYCAYGIEKKLKKLPFVDPNGIGNKGVLIDIKNQLITISIAPDVKVDIDDVYFSVKSSGYDVINIHLWLSGNIEDRGEKILLSDSKYGYKFELTGGILKELSRNKTIELKAHINKDEIESLNKDKPIKIIVDFVRSPKKESL